MQTDRSPWPAMVSRQVSVPSVTAGAPSPSITTRLVAGPCGRW